MPYPSEWSNPLPSTGSHHIPILLHFDAPFFRPPPPKPHWALSNWPLLDDTFKTPRVPPSPPSQPPAPWGFGSTPILIESQPCWPSTPLTNQSPTGRSCRGQQRFPSSASHITQLSGRPRGTAIVPLCCCQPGLPNPVFSNGSRKPKGITGMISWQKRHPTHLDG